MIANRSRMQNDIQQAANQIISEKHAKKLEALFYINSETYVDYIFFKTQFDKRLLLLDREQRPLLSYKEIWQICSRDMNTTADTRLQQNMNVDGKATISLQEINDIFDEKDSVTAPRFRCIKNSCTGFVTFIQQQTCAADEAATVTFTCSCGQRWRHNATFR